MSQEKSLRSMRFWFFMPVLVVPIVSIFFWLMGGGRGVVSASAQKGGLNLQLPGARAPQDSVADKLSFYDAAAVDSSRRVEQLRMDPYRKDTVVPIVHEVREHEYNPVGARLAAIQKRVAESKMEEPVFVEIKQPVREVAPVIATVRDPEMEAINSTLDKLMAIQHPPTSSPKAVINDAGAYEVNLHAGNDGGYFGKRNSSKSVTRFLGEDAGLQQKSNSIMAVIPIEQVLQNGSLVKIELRSAITINGVSLPAGTNVFGVAALESERLIIRVPSVRCQDKILPVALAVYDLDGLEGIYIPGAVARDVAKTSADNALQSVGVSSFDASLKTQAVSAGIGAAKSLLSKKVKQVRVTINAGYQVLLVDTKQKVQ